ncbi:MAG: glycosyltransferase family 4 protein [Pseudomonadota bacterium]
MTQLSPPTILQVIPEMDTGGAELSAIEMTQAVVRAGGRAFVATAGGRMEARITQAGGLIIALPLASKNPIRMAANARALAAHITMHGVDLVHARSRAPAWSALWAARSRRVPFVTTYHGAYNESGRLKRAYNQVMARGDVVIANSRYTRDLIQTRYGTPAERLQIIYRGVDVDRFDATRVEAARVDALREAWGIAPDASVIVHAARLTGWKGQAVVIDAVAQVKRQAHELLDNTVVVLAGDAQGREAYLAGLKAHIAREGLDDIFRLPGHCADMPAAFKLGTLAIVASTEPEAFGRAAAEAQAIGTPVISTNIGAPPETVLAPPDVAAHASTGWLVPPSDADALARAITQALRAPADERAARAARARAHVREAFTTRAMQHQTLAVYDELLGSALVQRFERADGDEARPQA